MHAIAALELLRAIVSDIQPELGTFCRSQRRRSMHFRDNMLESVFRLALSAASETLHGLDNFPKGLFRLSFLLVRT